MKAIRKSLLFSLTILALCSPIVRATRASSNEVVPGELAADPPTLRCLSFRWLLSGDDNSNATATVAYRRAGESAWHDALPLLRVNREVTDRDGAPYTAGNLLAGSVLNLSPATEYEIRFRLSDPDGGSAEKILKARTRPTPEKQVGARTLYAYPEGYAGVRRQPASTLAEAVRQAQPGDLILVHGAHPGPLFLPRSGSAEKPIVIRGDGEAVIRGPGSSGNVIDASGRDYLTFENLTLRAGLTGIKANGCKGLTVRNCRIEDVGSGVATFSPEAEGWYIADNEITGRVTNWYPRKDSSDTGVSCAGRGHVVCHNRIRRFWDCISIQNYGKPKPEWANALQPPQVAIDIYGNDCSEALDDGIEADGGLYNIRVFENRVMNVHSGITAQPNLGGPLYLVRNVVYNTTYTPLKLHNYPTGLIVYHNTLISAGQAFSSFPPAWQNATFRNNLFLGQAPYGMETGSPDRRTTLDYDGFMRKPGSELLIKWSADRGKSWGRYADLPDFTKATGHETHGILVDYGLFEKASPPREGQTHSVSEIDLRLKAGVAAMDAGCRVPTVNEGFQGKAPDLGAYEVGQQTPNYGPRQSRR